MHNVENHPSINARLASGANDRLNKARFLRMVCENVKRSVGVKDTVAFLRNDPANMPFWHAIIGSPSLPPGTSMHWMATAMVTGTVKWSWTFNENIHKGGSTLTGARTVSGMWRCNTNTEWGSVSMVTVGYELDTTENSWSNGFWLQLGNGKERNGYATV